MPTYVRDGRRSWKTSRWRSRVSHIFGTPVFVGLTGMQGSCQGCVKADGGGRRFRIWDGEVGGSDRRGEHQRFCSPPLGPSYALRKALLRSPVLTRPVGLAARPRLAADSLLVLERVPARVARARVHRSCLLLQPSAATVARLYGRSPSSRIRALPPPPLSCPATAPPPIHPTYPPHTSTPPRRAAAANVIH